LDDGALHVFSHWITPVGMPRRYDTWFFVAEAPDGHAYAHDDGETVASIWIRPLDALDAADRGELELIFPTRKNLEALSRFETASQLLDVVARATDVPPATHPRIVDEPSGGGRVRLPRAHTAHRGGAVGWEPPVAPRRSRLRQPRCDSGLMPDMSPEVPSALSPLV